MQTLFTPQYQWLWTLALTLALTIPLRQLIWVLAVRRVETREGQADEARRNSLKGRATVTAALLAFVFSFFYVNNLFSGPS